MNREMLRSYLVGVPFVLTLPDTWPDANVLCVVDFLADTAAVFLGVDGNTPGVAKQSATDGLNSDITIKVLAALNLGAGGQAVLNFTGLIGVPLDNPSRGASSVEKCGDSSDTHFGSKEDRHFVLLKGLEENDREL
jgi:hypothetical protein